MTAPTLRKYQCDIIDDFHCAVASGSRRIMLVAPTGSGKTIVFADIVRSQVAAGKSVLIFTHRREIISQTVGKLHALGVSPGIIQAGVSPRPLERVQVASIQTLHRRAIYTENMLLPLADVLIVDEAHHATAATYRAIINAYPNAILLGLTATPCRGDGRGLGGLFNTLIECPQVAELIEQGYLVKTRTYAPVNPDLKGVKTVQGDYHESQLAERMDRPALIGDVVTHWHKYGERRKTVCFAVNVAHSIHLRDEFINAGVRAEHIDGSTPKPERDATLQRLASSGIELVTNCMVLTEGWDMPEVGCCILARPTKKMGLYRQMLGRVLRPADGKPDAIILDHSGAVFRHGFVEDHVEWTLNPESRAQSAAHQARIDDGFASRICECTQCSAVRLAGQPCSHCGFMPQRPPRYIPLAAGELGLVDGKRRAKANLLDPQTRGRWHAMLTSIGIERGYKAGWAAVNYKEKFGTWPPYGVTPTPIDPTPEVRSWVRSRLIAYAKGRGAA